MIVQGSVVIYNGIIRSQPPNLPLKTSFTFYLENMTIIYQEDAHIWAGLTRIGICCLRMGFETVIFQWLGASWVETGAPV